MPLRKPGAAIQQPVIHREASTSTRRKWNGWTASIPILCFALIAGSVAIYTDAGALIRSVQTLRCEGIGDTAGTVNLSIKTGWLATPSIVLQLDNSFRAFAMNESSPTHYTASDNFKGPVNSKDRDGVADTVSLDRISGGLKWEAVNFQKGEEPAQEDELSCYLHGVSSEYCRSWKTGNFTRALYTYACRAASSKF